MMTEIRINSYFSVQRWMVSDLKLRGAERDAFAIIYGYSMDGESDFHGSLGYLSSLTGYSRNAMCTALKNLVQKDLILKTEKVSNNIKLCRYTVNFATVQLACTPVQPTYTLIENTVQPTCTPVQVTYTNNNIDNNTLSKDRVNKNKNNNLNFLGSATKKPKQNLYSQCIALINDYTDDSSMRELLITYLGVRLEMDTPLGVKQWAGLLKKLKTLDNQEDVIQQSINRGYKGFFAVNKPAYYKADNLHDRIGESGARNVPHITQEELDEIDRKVASGELRAY